MTSISQASQEAAILIQRDDARPRSAACLAIDPSDSIDRLWPGTFPRNIQHLDQLS